MSELFELILFYLVLFDSVFANIVAWGFRDWYQNKYKGLKKYLPLTRTWAAIYLFLVLWIGCAMMRLGILKLWW